MMGVNVGNSNVFKVETESDGTFMMELTEISLLFLGLDNGMQLLFSEKNNEVRIEKPVVN